MASRTSTDPIEILLEMGVDLDNLSEEEDYLSALKEAIATIQFQTKGAGDERSTILQQEVVKVRKQRKAADPKFKARKTKISADSFKRGTASPGEVRQNVKTGVIDPSKLKFSSVEVGPKPKALPTSAIVPYQAPEAEEEGEEKKKRKKKPKEKNLLADIAKSVVKIADILKEQYGVKKKSAEFDRKKAEQDKRALQKSKLSKGFEALVKGAQKVIAPVQSLLSRIFGFLFNLLLGKFIMKLLDWIGDPKNREKFFSVVRFLKDNWPKLIALYLVFGNSIGKFIFNLTKTLIGGAVKLTIAIAKLMAAKKIKGARGVARFLGKRGGLIGAGLATAATVGGALAVTNAVAGGGGEQQTQAYSGGGYVKPAPEMQPLPKKVTQERKEAKEKSGPLGFISGMSGAQKGMALGSMFGPLGMLAGAGIGSLFDNFGKNKEDKVKLSKPSEVTLEVPAESVDGGQVDGPGGIDKVPAMLTDGEFVMSRGAVQKIGVDKLEAMNAAGGGTNKPKVVDNKVYASVGGYVSGTDTGKKGTPDPKKEDESSGGETTPSIPSSAIKSSFVLALKDGIQGKLNTLTGKFIPKAFTEVERARYTQFGGKIPEKPKKPERSDFPMGRSGAKKYQEAKKSFEAAAATSKVTPKVTPKAITKTLTKEQLLGKSGVMPTADQLSATATKRHAELMKSTDQKKIADYDAKHGAGAYSKKLQEKLNKMYSPEKAKQMTTGEVKPTGKVVGRENLSPQAQAAIARLEAKKGLPPDMQYTRNGKRISAEEFNRTKNMVGAAKKGGAKGVLDHMVSGAKGMFGGMFGGLQGAVNNPKSFVESMGGTVRDGNIGTPTAEEQKAIDKLDAKRAEADKLEAYNKMMSTQGGLRKNLEKDPLFAEYEKIQDDVNHPLHDKVAGDLFDDTGTKDGMRFADFKKFKAQQSQAKLSPNQPQPKVSAPQPPTPPSNNVQVVKSGGSKGGGESQQSSNGSELPAMNAGNGSKSKFTLLGISF